MADEAFALSPISARATLPGEADYDAIREAFVRGALAAKQIGAAGVEVHACHGYLLDQFLWAETNRRTDGYGGEDIRARVRFPAEIVQAIRQAVGEQFPISFRFSQWKEVNYNARITPTPRDLQTMLTILRAAGVDVFHASARYFWVAEWPNSDLGIAGWTKSISLFQMAERNLSITRISSQHTAHCQRLDRGRV